MAVRPAFSPVVRSRCDGKRQLVCARQRRVPFRPSSACLPRGARARPGRLRDSSPASEKRTGDVSTGPQTVRASERDACTPPPPASSVPCHVFRALASLCRRRRASFLCLFRPQIRREYPPDLSILISGGKENNRDSPSSGERTGKSPSPNPAAHFCAAARMGVVAYGPASLPGRPRRSKSPLNGAMARRWCQASRAVVASRDRTAPSSLVA